MPAFESKAASQIDFDRMRVTIVHTNRAAVLDTVISIPSTVDTIDVSLRVPLASSSEDFLLYLRLVNAAGDTVLRNEPYPQQVTVSSGGGTAGTPVAVLLRATIASIVVTPPDVSFSSFGDTQRLSAVALDQNGVPLTIQPAAFVWLSSAPAIASVNPTTGLVTAVTNGSATISATASGVSGTLLVAVSQVATQLAFTTSPSTAAAGIIIAPPITVAAQDARGNAVTAFIDLVTVTIGANPGNSVLTGTTAKAAVAGVAQFADLRLDQPGTQYTLVFTTPNLPPITSVPFDVLAAPATVYWTNAAGGSWTTASNWSTGVVPRSSDNVVISVAGTYTVLLDIDATFAGLTLGGSSGTQTLTVPSHTLTLNGAGTVTANGKLQLVNGTVAGAGQLINKGTVDLAAGTLEAPLAFRNEGVIALHGYTYLNGPVTTVAGSVMRLEADYSSSYYSYATIASGFTNNATIELNTINGPGSVGLTVTTGTLANAPGAAINILAGTGGSRQLDAALDNQGTVAVGTATTWQHGASATTHRNSGIINVNANLTLNAYSYPVSTTFTNTGTITVAAGDTLKVSYGAVHYAAGTLNGNGTVYLSSDTLYLGQGLSNSVLTLLLETATVDGPGTFTNATGKALAVNASTINAPIDNQGQLTLRGYSYLNGSVSTAAGSVLRMVADYSTYYYSYATVANGFTNNGLIELTSVNGAGPASLAVTTGKLVNAPGSVLNVIPGSGGTRQLDLELDNQGSMTIGAATSLRHSASGAAHRNSGTLDVGANLTLDLYSSPATGTFMNTGTISIAAGDSLKASYGAIHYDGGTLSGAGTVALTSDTLYLGQSFSNSVVSLVLNSATVNGPGTITNATSKTLVASGSTINAPLVNQGLLLLRNYYNNLNGTVTTAAGSTMRVEGDYNAGPAYVTLATGFTNVGTLELTTINGPSFASFADTGGTLVNAAGATIDILGGTGGNCEFDVELDNKGTLSIAAPTTMSRSKVANHVNSGTLDVSGDLTVNQYGYPVSSSFTNTGSVTVAASHVWKISYGSFTHSAGTLSGAGALDLSNVTAGNFSVAYTLGDLRLNNTTASFATDQSTATTTYTLNGATVNGPGSLINVSGKTLVIAASTINSPLNNQGTLTLHGYYNNLNGPVTTASSSLMRVEGDYNSGPAYVTVANGFTNNGALELTTINGPSLASFADTGGSLVNGAAGTINVLAGAGGSRQFDVELNNQGAVSIGAPTTMSRSKVANHVNSGTWDVSAGDLTINQYGSPIAGSFTNTGAITVRASRVWKIVYGSFTHGTAGSLGGAGGLDLSNVTAGNFNAALTLGELRLNNSTANFATDQSTATTAYTINGSTVNGPGRLINANGKTLAIAVSTINAPLDNQGTLTLHGYYNNLNGAVTTAASSLMRVEGDYNVTGPAYVTVANGFTNNGTLELTTINGPSFASFSDTGGTLVNSSTGAVNVLGGAGGNRDFDVELNNQGTVSIGAPTNMSRAKVTNHINTGTLDVSGGDLTLSLYATPLGSFTNNGTITIGAGRVWKISYGFFTHNSGGLGGAGALDLSSVSAGNFNVAHTLGELRLNSSTANFATDQSTAATAFTLNNAIVNGPGIFTNAASKTLVVSATTLNAPLDNQGTLALHGYYNNLNGPITTTAGSIMRAEGDYNASPAYVTVASGFTNNGTLELTTINGPSYVIFADTGGTLVNSTSAVINVLGGSGGTREFDVELNNQGTVNVVAPTTINRGKLTNHLNSGTVNISGGDLTLNQYASPTAGSFTNNGTVQIGAGQQLKITYGSFADNVGATLDGAGAMVLTSVTAADFNTSQTLGAVTLVTSTATFATTQSTAGTLFTFNQSTVNGTGTLTNASLKTLSAYYSTINLPLVNQGDLTLLGSSNLSGPVTTTSGSTLRVQGDNYGSYATVANGFTNNGTLELTSINGGGSAGLAVITGTLINALNAAINVLPGTGGSRQLDFELNNMGSVNIAAATTTTHNPVAVHSNSGIITLGGGDWTINQVDNGNFTNLAGGLIDLGPSNILHVTLGTVSNALNGKIVGSGTFDVRVPARYTNDGELSPGKSPGILTVAGDPTLSPTSTLTIELGQKPTDPSDRLDVTGNATLDGTLGVSSLAGSSAGTFTVMTFKASTGQFARVSPLPANCNIQPIYTPTSVQIVCS